MNNISRWKIFKIKHSNFYFRKSQDSLLEKAKHIDVGYFIMRDEKIIGGVFIEPNYMCDLFVIPPYRNYEELGGILIKYIKEISDKDKEILLHEIMENYVEFYESMGFQKGQNGFWMSRPTEKMEPMLQDGYEAMEITQDLKNEIGELIANTYNENPNMGEVRSKEEYIESVEYYINYHKGNQVINRSSKVVVFSETN